MHPDNTNDFTRWSWPPTRETDGDRLSQGNRQGNQRGQEQGKVTWTVDPSTGGDDSPAWLNPDNGESR